ncbi:MAG: flagellar assembly protein FliW [Chloroflexi bacterium]|jgi:flagellar assembly factor FliW|nr:flagellar assembly protein FliW [Chloroflexota bacterium]
MDVQTTRFGVPETVPVEDEALLVFPHGLPGFESHVHFALLEEPAYLPFCWLQSLHDPDVAFIMLDPFLLRPDYDFELSPADVALLQLDEHTVPRVFCILVVPGDVRQMTANLKAPVVLNPRRRLGKQVILTDDRYPLRHPVLAAQDALQPLGAR